MLLKSRRVAGIQETNSATTLDRGRYLHQLEDVNSSNLGMAIRADGAL